MKAVAKWAIRLAFLVLVVVVGWPGHLPRANSAAPPQVVEGYDFVFLAEARPVLIRVRAELDGVPVQSAWDDFMKYLFNYLDVNGDGVLDKGEAERVPSVDQIRTGALAGFGGGRLGGGSQISFAELDTDKDGKVTLAEMSVFYYKKGLVPFRIQPESSSGGKRAAMAAVGVRSQPTVDAVNQAIFEALDLGKTGKLTIKELTAAQTVLLQRDENEDEILTVRELLANREAKLGGLLGMVGEVVGGGNKMLMPVANSGRASTELVRALQTRYGPKFEKAETRKLSQKHLGVDHATFRRLDTNGDGVLDDKELASFTNRPADLELVVRIDGNDARVELVTAKGRDRLPLAAQVKSVSGVALLDLGKSRVELRGSEEVEYGLGGFAELARQQLIAQFKQADKDKDGYLDQKEADSSRVFKGLFKAMDRDGDGKLYEREMIAYLDKYTEIQERLSSACVSLVFSDESRGLFDLLDTNRDGRLSIREMRGAPGLMKRLDPDGKGYIIRADLPRSYRLTLRRGQEGDGNIAAFQALYGSSNDQTKVKETSVGPRWFRKMDRNRDGDVSRKEFLFGDELFRQIDTDGDGLISVEEAEKAADLIARKLGRPQR